MKHAAITAAPGSDPFKKCVEAETADGQKVYLVEQEYSQAELDVFHAEKSKWIIRRAGTQYFLADSDSGEDARGHYCGYFDPEPANAVFDKGRLVGYYLCPGDFRYSGKGRASFSTEEWGYPGEDPFTSAPRENQTHVFLFSEAATHEWKDWDLLVRDPERTYQSYLDF
ncbi:MAG: hypothetical protein E7426_06320 [Ruminococcaceae bacterium]|nr:hypothetical protein [Oscillospiraceae bacterium]